MDTGQGTDAGGSFAWCGWHEDYSRSARLVQLEDQGSGHSGRGNFACLPCRQKYGLVPLADQP